jgi:hypothetical protein
MVLGFAFRFLVRVPVLGFSYYSTLYFWKYITYKNFQIWIKMFAVLNKSMIIDIW